LTSRVYKCNKIRGLFGTAGFCGMHIIVDEQDTMFLFSALVAWLQIISDVSVITDTLAKAQM